MPYVNSSRPSCTTPGSEAISAGLEASALVRPDIRGLAGSRGRNGQRDQKPRDLQCPLYDLLQDPGGMVDCDSNRFSVPRSQRILTLRWGPPHFLGGLHARW